MDGTINAPRASRLLGRRGIAFLRRSDDSLYANGCRKEPVAGFSSAIDASVAQLFKQLGLSMTSRSFAALSSADMNHHALAVDIAGLGVLPQHAVSRAHDSREYLTRRRCVLPGWYRLSFRFPMIHREKSVTAISGLDRKGSIPSINFLMRC